MQRCLLFMLVLLFAVPGRSHASEYLVWSANITGNVHSVFVDANGLAYIGCEYGGVKIYDTTATGGAEYVGGWEQQVNGTSVPSRELLLVDNILIVAQREGGTRFLDISDPANPILVATIDNPVAPNDLRSRASRLAIQGDILYVSSVIGGFSRIDISDINNPILLDTIGFTNASGTQRIESQGIFIDANYAYVATPWAGWSIVDIGNLAEMEIVNSIPKPTGIQHGVWDVYVKNGVAFALAQGYGVQIFDVSDIHNVFLLSEIRFQEPEDFGPDTPPADILFLTDSIASISYGSLGVYIYDLSDLTAAVLLATLTAENMVAVNIFLQGTELYVAGYRGGLYVFDVSSFMTPAPATLLLGLTGLAMLQYKRRKMR